MAANRLPTERMAELTGGAAATMMFLPLLVKTVRLALLRVGIGWMFALLAFNFNRVTIADLGGIGVVVTSLIGLHHFLAPFQVVWGRFADRYPLLGYRRTPFIILSALVGSLIFLVLPTLAIDLGSRSPLALVVGVVLFIIFGLAMAANGTATFALIAETTSERERGFVVAFTHVVTILSAIFSAGVARQIMPDYSPEQMQALYNLTPLITLGTTLLGIVGLEQRHAPLPPANPGPAAGEAGAWRIALRLLQTNGEVRGFFTFVLLAILGIFLQDAILEVFGAEVFALSPAETSSFTQTWGGGVLLGMLAIGLFSAFVPLSKKLIATIGGLGTALALALVALCSLQQNQTMLQPALLLMGLGVGLFNVGAMSMMMEMTVAGYTGLYMGIWGAAQGLGNGLANVLSGALHTLLIETGLLAPGAAYGLIFGLEALLMLLALLALRGISVQRFRGLGSAELGATLALDAAG